MTAAIFERRNALIPMAAEHADTRYPEPKGEKVTKAEREQWVKQWSTEFHFIMNRLAKRKAS